MNKLSNPPIFKESLNKKPYFESWYIKCLSDDFMSSIAFIPGIFLGKDPHAFIQINMSNNKSEYIRFPVEKISYEKDVFAVALGDNYFSDRGLRLNHEQNGISLQGDLVFNNMRRYSSHFLSPGIIGVFTHIPFLQSHHAIMSIRHEINGLLTINGQDLGFEKGCGYIEKNWGHSFPKSWLWMQANPFQDSEASFMLSIAKIPLMGIWFTGLVGFLNDGEKTYHFATHLGHGLAFLEENEGDVYIHIKGPKYHLRVYAEIGETATLIAPTKGQMDRNIKESLNSSLYVELSDKRHNIIFRDSAHIAGLKISGDINKLCNN